MTDQQKEAARKKAADRQHTELMKEKYPDWHSKNTILINKKIAQVTAEVGTLTASSPMAYTTKKGGQRVERKYVPLHVVLTSLNKACHNAKLAYSIDFGDATHYSATRVRGVCEVSIIDLETGFTKYQKVMWHFGAGGPDQTIIQSQGAMMTYMRRYALLNAFNISTSDEEKLDPDTKENTKKYIDDQKVKRGILKQLSGLYSKNPRARQVISDQASEWELSNVKQLKDVGIDKLQILLTECQKEEKAKEVKQEKDIERELDDDSEPKEEEPSNQNLF